jgi:apolipoprotein N-acyltransferase
MRALALAALAGLLYWAAQPPLALGSLAFLALVPLLLAVRGVGPWRALVLGWLAGTIACNGLTSASIHAALLRAGHPGWLAAAEGLVIPQLCGALYFAAFAAYAAALERRRPGTAWRIVLLPAAWVACEFARSRIGNGMPWVLLAHAEIGRPWLLQVADVAGAYGVSFVVAMVNVLVAMLLERPAAGWPRLRRPLAGAAAVLAAVVVYGRVELARWREPAGRSLRVALVQGDVPEEWRTDLRRLPAVLARYRDLVAEAARERPELVVLPENAAGVSPSANPQVLTQIAAPLAGSDALLLLGAPRAVSLGPGRAAVRNSAFLVDAAGTLRTTYDKMHLVPFGETSTWLLPAALQRRLGLPDDYSAGDAATLFDVDGARAGVLICWEGIYAGAARALARAGATLLVNLSNDDWFGGHAAAEQHFRATLLRAVETRRPLLRATNSGVTALVDPRGVVVAAGPRDAIAVVSGTVTALSTSTLYTRIGDVFAWACLVAALGALLVPPGPRGWRSRDGAPGRRDCGRSGRRTGSRATDT